MFAVQLPKSIKLMAKLIENIIKSLLSGSSLAVWVLDLWLGFNQPVEKHVDNESSF